MKQTLTLFAIVFAAGALLLAAQPLRDVDEAPSQSTGGTPSQPVDVTNFPTDEYGAITVAPSVANRVVDLLDEAIVVTGGNPFWTSVTFESMAFTSYSIMVNGSISNDGTVSCQAEWQFTEDDPFLGLYGPSGGTLLDNDNILLSVSRPVNGLRGRVSCFTLGATGTLADVKVLLRRE